MYNHLDQSAVGTMVDIFGGDDDADDNGRLGDGYDNTTYNQHDTNTESCPVSASTTKVAGQDSQNLFKQFHTPQVPTPWIPWWAVFIRIPGVP